MLSAWVCCSITRKQYLLTAKKKTQIFYQFGRLSLFQNPELFPDDFVGLNCGKPGLLTTQTEQHESFSPKLPQKNLDDIEILGLPLNHGKAKSVRNHPVPLSSNNFWCNTRSHVTASQVDRALQRSGTWDICTKANALRHKQINSLLNWNASSEMSRKKKQPKDTEMYAIKAQALGEFFICKLSGFQHHRTWNVKPHTALPLTRLRCFSAWTRKLSKWKDTPAGKCQLTACRQVAQVSAASSAALLALFTASALGHSAARSAEAPVGGYRKATFISTIPSRCWKKVQKFHKLWLTEKEICKVLLFFFDALLLQLMLQFCFRKKWVQHCFRCKIMNVDSDPPEIFSSSGERLRLESCIFVSKMFNCVWSDNWRKRERFRKRFKTWCVAKWVPLLIQLFYKCALRVLFEVLGRTLQSACSNWLLVSFKFISA